jgi:hypothetical protein
MCAALPSNAADAWKERATADPGSGFTRACPVKRRTPLGAHAYPASTHLRHERVELFLKGEDRP